MLAISHETVHISNDIFNGILKKRRYCNLHISHENFVFVKTMLKIDQGSQPIKDKKQILDNII